MTAYGEKTRCVTPSPNIAETISALDWNEGRHLCPWCREYGFEFGPTVRYYD